MKMIQTTVLVIVASMMIGLTHGQTTDQYCPTGEYVNYISSAYQQLLSPVTYLAGTTYNSGGLYAVTAANGADQCCYNCLNQTNGQCTTWTYDACKNVCYLSSATGTSNYLNYTAPTYTSNGFGGYQTCYYTSGFNNASTSLTTTPATTTLPTTTTTTGITNCRITTGTNVASTNDKFTNAASASGCCNICGSTPGCLGFAFLAISNTLGGCWLKSYDPLGTSTPSPTVAYPGMVMGDFQTSG